MKKLFYISCFSLLGTWFLNGQTLVANPQDNNFEGGQLKLMNSNVTYNPWNIDNYAGHLRFFHDGTVSVYLQVTPSGNVGIGTATPSVKLDVENGDLYVGEEVSSNGQRRQIRVYGFDNSTKFYGSIHSNYDDGRRTFDINTNSYVQQIKIDASASTNGNIILNPGINGYVGVGTIDPDAKLTVKGNIHTQEVKVDLLGAVAPDYVFYKGYDLKSLQAVEDYIAINGHLPNIPSAKDMETEGIKLKEMNLKLLEKIEELTLYAIEQEKKLEVQEARLQKLEVYLNSKK